jgi:hypothetical protein
MLLALPFSADAAPQHQIEAGIDLMLTFGVERPKFGAGAHGALDVRPFDGGRDAIEPVFGADLRAGMVGFREPTMAVGGRVGAMRVDLNGVHTYVPQIGAAGIFGASLRWHRPVGGFVAGEAYLAYARVDVSGVISPSDPIDPREVQDPTLTVGAQIPWLAIENSFAEVRITDAP